ncbi:MAG: conjugal transfer protein TraF [Bacteroidales bacterium]|jgi:thioredoxin|nr:conjugal transfer protein TraF [Bacteroidales bacterium]
MRTKIILTAIFSFLLSGLFAQIRTVSVEEFEKQLIASKGDQLIDVRTPQEFEKHRITSAQNMNFRSANFRENIDKLDKSKPVLVYCLSGARSKSALTVFQEAGFKTVYNLNGGINAWSKLGMPIVQDLSGKGELPLKDYDAAISAKGYVLVDFYAPWCGPCRKMLPIVQELEKMYSGKFKLLTVDFDQNRLLVKEKNIKSVPYLMVFKDGKKIWEKSEEASKEELMEVLKLK